MTSEEHNIPLKELRESLKRYSDAKMKAYLYRKRQCDEAENLFSHFIKYAKEERNKGDYNFSKIIDNFYYEILDMDYDSKDRAVRASLTKRFKAIMKKHIINDPKYQVKLDEFIP